MLSQRLEKEKAKTEIPMVFRTVTAHSQGQRIKHALSNTSANVHTYSPTHDVVRVKPVLLRKLTFKNVSRPTILERSHYLKLFSFNIFTHSKCFANLQYAVYIN